MRADLALERLLDGFRPRAQFAEDRTNHTFALLDEGQEQVLGLDRLVARLVGDRLRRLHRLLSFHCELVESHAFFFIPCTPADCRCAGRSVFDTGPAPPPLRVGGMTILVVTN